MAAPTGHRSGPSRFAEIARAPLAAVFAVGAARLAINASTLALYIPAPHAITHSAAGLGAKAACFLMLFLLTEAAVLVPVVAVTVRGEAAKPMLAKIHDVIEAQESRMVIWLALGFGGALLLVGLRITALL